MLDLRHPAAGQGALPLPAPGDDATGVHPGSGAHTAPTLPQPPSAFLIFSPQEEKLIFPICFWSEHRQNYVFTKNIAHNRKYKSSTLFGRAQLVGW